MSDQPLPTDTEEKIPEGTEVTTSIPVLKKGTVQIGSRAAWNANPPYWMIILFRTWFFSASGISTIIGGTDYLTGAQSKKLMFFMGLAGFIIGGLAKAMGVVSPAEEKGIRP